MMISAAVLSFLVIIYHNDWYMSIVKISILDIFCKNISRNDIYDLQPTVCKTNFHPLPEFTFTSKLNNPALFDVGVGYSLASARSCSLFSCSSPGRLYPIKPFFRAANGYNGCHTFSLESVLLILTNVHTLYSFCQY